MSAYQVSALELRPAARVRNRRQSAGDLRTGDRLIRVDAGEPFQDARQLRELVVGVFDGRPVFLKDVAQVDDGPDEVASYVRHGFGPARGFTKDVYFPSSIVGKFEPGTGNSIDSGGAQPAVTIAIAKKKGANAVSVANAVLHRAEELQRKIVPS